MAAKKPLGVPPLQLGWRLATWTRVRGRQVNCSGKAKQSQIKYNIKNISVKTRSFKEDSWSGGKMINFCTLNFVVGGGVFCCFVF